MDCDSKPHCCLSSVFRSFIAFIKPMRGSRKFCQSGSNFGGPSPPIITKNIGFLSSSGPDPRKNQKATKPEYNDGPQSARQRNAI